MQSTVEMFASKKKSLTQKIHLNINTCKYIIPNEKYILWVNCTLKK